MDHHPPAWVLKLLRWFCPPGIFEEIEGDLLQRYDRDARRHGKHRAAWRMFWSVVRFLRPGILLRNKFSVPSGNGALLLNYFKTTLRHIRKSKLNFAFKLGGLTLALGSVLVIVLYVSFQLSFDRFHRGYEQIYRLNSTRLENGAEIKYATVPPALGPAAKAAFAEVQASTGVSEWGQALTRYGEKLLRIEGFVEADSTLFDVFTFEILHGDPHPLNYTDAVVLTASTARRIFGDADPLNKLIVFPDRFNRVLEVRAVIADLPANSSLRISAIMNFGALRDKDDPPPDFWSIGWGGYNLFVKLDPRANAAAFSEKLKPLLKKNLAKSADGREKHFKVSLQPLSEIYLGDYRKWEFDTKGDSLYLYLYSALAVFLVVMACINYLNLSIADFNFRNKEVGVRKILGARKKQVAGQLVIETLLYCLTALALSVGSLYLLFPQILQRLDPGLRFGMILDGPVIAWVGMVLFLIILLSAAYPAYRLTVNKPIDDLKRSPERSNTFSISRILLLSQFTISLFCITASWVLGDQLNFMRSRDIGFDRKNILTMIMPDRYPLEKAPVIKREISRVAGVEAVSFSYYHPTASSYFNDLYELDVHGETRQILVNEVFVDHDVFKTMGHTLLEGRVFDGNNPNEAQSTCIVNETAVGEFGWTHAIGQPVTWGEGTERRHAKVIGVVKDFNTLSLRSKIQPLIMRLQYDLWPGLCLNVRFSGNARDLLPRLQKSYERVMPEYLIEFGFVEDRYDSQYRNEDQAYTTLQAATWIIVLISSTGIFSLSAYMSVRRMKEFGIRKVLGATVGQIAALHIFQFIRIALLANVLAMPLAYWILSEWLDQYAYKTTLSSAGFLAIGGTLIVLVLVSAGYSTWKAGRMNPVDVIKIE